MSAREEFLHKAFVGEEGVVAGPAFVYEERRPIMTMTVGPDGEPGWRFPCRLDLELQGDCSQWRIEQERRAQARLETHFGMLSR